MKEQEVREKIDQTSVRVLDVLDRPIAASLGAVAYRVTELSHLCVCLVTQHRYVMLDDLPGSSQAVDTCIYCGHEE